MIRAVGRDTRTRFQGVFARHRKACAKERNPQSRCTCRPSFYGVVWDREDAKPRKTRFLANATAARNARGDLARQLDMGERPERFDVRVGEASDRFVKAARDGVALNKHGRRYKRSALADLEQTLRQHVVAQLGRQRRLSDVRRHHCQQLVDDLVEAGKSGSRVRSVVNAIRSLYRWAQDRELVAHDPAALVRLPAMNAKPRERVATPGELRRLLDALKLADAVPFALAAYSTARRSEILAVRWRDVDFERGVIVLGADPDARKYDASLRVVPLLKPARALLRRHYLAESRPDGGQLVCKPRRYSKSGRLAATALQRRAVDAWESAELTPIGLQDCRHTAASWMDAAGVSPKVASALMGHSTPERQPGAADITLNRYTHTLPDYVETAREQLDGFLVERERRERANG